jgi:hypothetical protein
VECFLKVIALGFYFGHGILRPKPSKTKTQKPNQPSITKTLPTPNQNLEPQTPNPKPQTPNPKPKTPNPKPQIQNSKFKTQNSKLQTPNPDSKHPIPGPETLKPEPGSYLSNSWNWLDFFIVCVGIPSTLNLKPQTLSPYTLNPEL